MQIYNTWGTRLKENKLIDMLITRMHYIACPFGFFTATKDRHCTNYAHEFSIPFNAAKSKFIAFRQIGDNVDDNC